MPELPEVEVVRAGLAPAVTGGYVSSVDVVDERAITRHRGSVADFESRLTGVRFLQPQRRGKFLWIPYGDGSEALLAHLGMSGQLLLGEADAAPQRHERVRVIVQDADGCERAVIFVDQRTFGSLAIDALVAPVNGARLVPHQAAHIAPDPLEADFDPDAVVAALRRSRSAVKRVLLDQTVVSGIGNIYADETLWAARVHPETVGISVSPQKARLLLVEAAAVMQRALAEGGTSFDTQYVNVNGQSGYFARSLNAYGREGEPCRRCGTPLRRVAFQNRSSFFCPRCQR